MRNPTLKHQPADDQPDTHNDLVLRELRALREMFNEFASALLNAKFPYGKPTDRWRKR